MEKLREVKDETEVAAIREAIRVAEQGFAALTATLRPTDTEKDLGDLLDGYVRRAGGDGMAFPTIVGVGERSALPHANLSDRPRGVGAVLPGRLGGPEGALPQRPDAGPVGPEPAVDAGR